MKDLPSTIVDTKRNVDEAELEKFATRAEQWWDEAGPFRTLHQINPLRVEYLRQRMVLRDATVLDVGCGGGLLAEALAAEGARVTAIDMAEANVRVAASHAAHTGYAIDYRCTEVADVAAREPASFDIVTCLELLEHVPRPREVVAACAAAVKPGGTVVFSTISRNAKSFLLAIVGAEHLLRMIPRGTHEYLKLIQPSELATWCRGAGLTVKELSGLHFNPLLQTYALGGNVDVNYFLRAVRPPIEPPQI